MSCRRSTESHQNINKSFRIRHDDLKLFSRFLSRQETSNSSFRVYCRDVSVPFVWESQPGTPKHRFTGDDGGGTAVVLRPPLTPPPSYYCRSPAPAKKTVGARSVLLRALLTKVSLRRSTRARSPSSPSFSLSPSFSTTTSTSSSSLSSFSATPRRRRTRRLSGSGSSFDKGIEDISSAEYSGICCGSISMKKVLFSILGRQRQS